MATADLIQGTELKGDAAHLDVATATRLGRAFGTVLRRRGGGGAKVVVLARGGDGEELPVRDGLARGLVLTGHEVHDLGVASEAQLAVAVDRLEAAGAAQVPPVSEGVRRVRFLLGRRPLGDEVLAELAALADGDDFSAGTGSLVLVDPRQPSRSAGARG
ncbi:MAG: hypothetical protein IT383_20155 [Deltaproteobacteria bacterium]|nr:hypothetical protein [Deltaproteobacteria bacterium]